MKEFFKSYQNILLLLSVFILASILISGNVKKDKSPNILERGALAISAPLQSLVTSAVHNVVAIWEGYIYLVGTEEKNKILIKALAKERFNNHLLTEELKRYSRIEHLITAKPIRGAEFKVSEVVGWDSTNLSQTAVINIGKSSGIKSGMVALTHQGLVGRVMELAGNSSKVLMLTDSRSAVDAYLQDSRIRAVVAGQNSRYCKVKYLPIDADVKVGDTLISSGLGTIFPKGIPLGKITSLKPGVGRLFYKAEMEPAANLKQLEEMLVITKLAKKDDAEWDETVEQKIEDKKSVAKTATKKLEPKPE